MYSERYRHSCIYSRLLPVIAFTSQIVADEDINRRTYGSAVWAQLFCKFRSDKLRLSRKKNNLRFSRQILTSLRQAALSRLCFFRLAPPAQINFSPFFQSQTFYRFSFWSCPGQKHFYFPVSISRRVVPDTRHLNFFRPNVITQFVHSVTQTGVSRIHVA